MATDLLGDVLRAFVAPALFGSSALSHRRSFGGVEGGEDVVLAYEPGEAGSIDEVRLEHTVWDDTEAGPRTQVALVVTLLVPIGTIRDAHDGLSPLESDEAARRVRALIARLGGEEGVTVPSSDSTRGN